MKKRRTIFVKSSDVQRKRYIVDAAGKILGRMASLVAVYLRGKHKPNFTPQTDCGDFIVIVNAEKVAVSGKKLKQKLYFTHSGFPAGDKLFNYEKMMEKHPEKVVQLAVRGMLPHNRLGDKMIKKLKIFRGERPEFKKWEKLGE